MTDFHLAQFNIGRFKYPIDSPEMAEFVARLDPINALADAAPGFVWRYTAEGANDATSIRPYADDDQIAINFSVWRSREELWEFVYRSGHLEVLRRRPEWFTRVKDSYVVLWWVPAGHLPTVEEAMDRLGKLRANGPTPEAFDFRSPFDAPAAPVH